MATKWTEEQLSAITSRRQNLLLSAAAGSGKTAVLVQRIIARLTNEENPIDADRLLVVTFTNAAANEMRERIIKELETLLSDEPQNELLLRQLKLAKKAKITTIDSFCIDILRKYFVEAELSPDFTVADPTECKVILEDVLDDVIDAMYDDKEFGADFLNLMEAYSNSKANDVAFRQLLTSLYYFTTSLPKPFNWLLEASEKFNLRNGFANSDYKEFLLDEIYLELERCVSEYSIMVDMANKDMFSAYESLLREEKDFFESCLRIRDYSSLKNAIDSYIFKRRPAVPKNIQTRYTETVNEMRDKIKARRMGKLRDKLLALSEENQELAIAKVYPLMKCLSETVRRIFVTFGEMKMAKNMLDFSDCEHRCLELLTKDGQPTEIAKLLRDSFDEIYIDEYQDTSKLQEAIFASIKKENNLFMVGDIKQSIYRFRNTDPALFKAKRDEYSKDEDAQSRKIILSKNFRSRENILSSVNCIFERIMSKDSGEIDYNEDEKLYLGADYPDTAVNPMSYETEIAIIDTASLEDETDDELKKAEFEAIYCANRIAELIESGVQIFDHGEYRPITYRDICVISRNVKDNAVILNSVFADYGIPCYSENTGSYFDSREVEIMLCMLAVIDNPYQDLPLLSVLRSVMFNVTADELAKIRSCNKKKSFYDAILDCSKTQTDEGRLCCEIIETIEKFVEKSKYMSVSELVLDIYNTTGFYDAQESTVNGTIRRANLRLLYNRAKKYEATGLRGLYSFIKFINDFKNSGNDLEAAKLASEQNDAVRIMSIHKSKGLEFPVVILFSAERKFNLMDLHKSVLYHADLGYGPKFVDTDLRITYNFAPRAALESVLYRESVAEEMRILYVALTRAKEKLIIIGADKDIEKKVRNCLSGEQSFCINGALVSEHTSYLDWIIMALVDHKDAYALRSVVDADRDDYIYNHESKFDFKIIQSAKQLGFDKNFSMHKETTKNVDCGAVTEMAFYEYEKYEETRLPSKVTVSELKKRKETELSDEGITAFPKAKKITKITDGLTASQVGVAYHTVLQKYDLSAPSDTEKDVIEQIEKIKEKGFLTEEEARNVNPDKILKFFTSGTGRMIKSAKYVKREYMFAVSIPAKNFIKDSGSDREIMLQGIIDCLVITDEGIVVVDYKTDRDFDETETVEKYRVQLECYKYAAEKIFQKPVISKILFMLDSGMGMTL